MSAELVLDLMITPGSYATVEPRTPLSVMAAALGTNTWQTSFPVLDGDGTVAGVVPGQFIEALSPEGGAQALAVAADLMQPLATIEPGAPARRAAELLLETELRQLTVVGPDRKVLGFQSESDIMRAP